MQVRMYVSGTNPWETDGNGVLEVKSGGMLEIQSVQLLPWVEIHPGGYVHMISAGTGATIRRVDFRGGYLSVDTAGKKLNVGDCNLMHASSYIVGAGILNIDYFDWTFGWMGSTGYTYIKQTGRFNLPIKGGITWQAHGLLRNTRKLVNEGVVEWTQGDVDFDDNENSLFINHGTVNVKSTCRFGVYNPGSNTKYSYQVQNFGTIVRQPVCTARASKFSLDTSVSIPSKFYFCCLI